MVRLSTLNTYFKQHTTASLAQLATYFDEDKSVVKQKLRQLSDLGYIRHCPIDGKCQRCPLQKNCQSDEYTCSASKPEMLTE